MSINLVTITFFLFFLPNLFSVSIARDTLTPSQSLTGNETLVSKAGTFALGFFSPSAGSNKQYLGIWYNNISVQTVVWVANRQNPIISSNGTLSISNEGALIITGTNSTIIWSSGVNSGATSPSAQLLDNGNFFVTAVNSNTNTKIVTWQSFDYPTNTLLPGMRLGWDLRTGLNRNLTSWAAANDPSPGPYVVYIDIRGDPQLVIKEGSNWFWRGGPWDGERFTGIPEMETHNAFNFSFVDNSDDIYYTYNIIDDAILSRVVVDQFGTCQRLVWLDQSEIWNVFWAVPRDNCDGISLCGPFGVCNANDSPICNCLQGFVPKSPYDWSLRDGTGGCIRKTPLNCKSGTDGFLTVNGAKLPDTSTATVKWNIGLDDCRQVCLLNCSCTAYASANTSGSGSGCIIWTQNITDLRTYDDGGQDLYVRLAAADLDLPQVQSHWKRLAIVAIMGGTVSSAFLLACTVICRRKKKMKRALMSTATSFKDGVVEGKEFELPLFDIDTIVLATNNFCVQNKLGEGGFGPVYKGELRGQEIAVKRLARSSVQGVEEFKNEVMLIAKLQHRNLVRLLGCCIEEEERILVYEYMPNKSLDAFLFANATSLDWQTRYHIISGIARGLLYLHHESRLRIIHRDLKASNILLDKDMNPKISDFGMARISGGDDTEANTIKVVGTYGYMAPEYAMDGTFSVKSDVFSFGVLVLEIICGKKNRGIFLEEPHLNLLGYAWNLWNEGNGLDLVDDTICHSFPILEAMTCIKVGLLCVQARPEDRPTMSSVVFMLGSDHAALPRPKQPGFVAKKYRFDTDFSSTTKKSLTVNGLTITALGGR